MKSLRETFNLTEVTTEHKIQHNCNNQERAMRDYDQTIVLTTVFIKQNVGNWKHCVKLGSLSHYLYIDRLPNTLKLSQLFIIETNN